MRSGSLPQWDRPLAGATLGLSIISVIAITSASAQINPALAWHQAVWVGLGMVTAVLVARVPAVRWIGFAATAYGLSLALLAFVLIGGENRLGATRWISLFGLSVQPIECAKLTTILWLARYLVGQPTPLSTRALWISLGVAGLPATLVFLQPDLGSATILLAIWFGMACVAGLTRRHLATLGALGATFLPVAWHFLKPYQRDRLLAFIDPHADPLGAGYTIIQSQIAIGAGRWLGRGWFAGTQNQLSFLPERHSDFLFSVIGEEWGLVGCLVVLAAFGVLLFRVVEIAMHRSSPHGCLLATGIFSWIAYQMLVNLGMVMGLLPVVGVPLPLLSYGGSSMIVVWATLGLLQQVQNESR